MADGTAAKLAHLRAPITELDFSEEEIRRYSRHIVLPEVGGTGQKHINHASVLVVGAGGLGSPVAYYLAAAGVPPVPVIQGNHGVEFEVLHRRRFFHRPDWRW